MAASDAEIGGLSHEAPAHVYEVNQSVGIGELKLGRLLIGIFVQQNRLTYLDNHLLIFR